MWILWLVFEVCGTVYTQHNAPHSCLKSREGSPSLLTLLLSTQHALCDSAVSAGRFLLGVLIS